MKFIHTGDWHIGQTFYGYDRCGDAEAMLRQIAVIAREEQPDALLVCGDVFHNSVPSSAAQRVYADGLLKIRNACPSMVIVVIAGNHDSPSRLGAYSGLWQVAGVHVVTTVAESCVPIEAGGGLIVPVPFVTPSLAGRVMDDAVKSAVAVNGDGKPVVLMAHQAVVGVDTAGHHNLPDVAMDFINIPQGVVDAVDYIALGHIHSPQSPLKNKARYSGSPLAVHFDEATYTHSVAVVTLKQHGIAPVERQVPITPPTPLFTVPDKPSSLDVALGEMRLLADTTCYVRLNIDGDHCVLPHDAKEQAVNTAGATTDPETALPRVRFCEFKVNRTEVKLTATGEKALTVNEIADINIVDVMERYLRRIGREPLTDDERLIINDIINED